MSAMLANSLVNCMLDTELPANVCWTPKAVSQLQFKKLRGLISMHLFGLLMLASLMFIGGAGWGEAGQGAEAQQRRGSHVEYWLYVYRSQGYCGMSLPAAAYC